jgi:hypothetical protein
MWPPTEEKHYPEIHPNRNQKSFNIKLPLAERRAVPGNRLGGVSPIEPYRATAAWRLEPLGDPAHGVFHFLNTFPEILLRAILVKNHYRCRQATDVLPSCGL